MNLRILRSACFRQGCARFLLILLLTAANLRAQPTTVSKWIEVPYPKDDKSAEAVLWGYRANYSKHEWMVFRQGDTVGAHSTTEREAGTKQKPNFTPKAETFNGAKATVKVADGWLVGFNHGEWGGALYWFGNDGATKYRISEHQIVDFVETSNGIVAIEGLAHLGISEGSVISISLRDKKWTASTLRKLPEAPEAVTPYSKGNLLIVLSGSLVTVDSRGKIKVIVKKARWNGLYPNSVVLSADEKDAYVGMRQFVAKAALGDGRVSFLVPDESYVNKLPPEEETRILKSYGGR